MNVDSLVGRRVHHVAVAVPSIEEASPLYQLLSGLPCSTPETVASQGVRVAFCGLVELVEPLDPDNSIGRFLARRGPGLHHIAYESSDLRADLEDLAARGFELIDEEPRAGSAGHQVAFIHPRSTGGVLVELVQP